MACLALEYRDFSFAYEGGPAIGPLNWRVHQGDFVLLTGDTGSGKTTLLRCAKPELAPTGKHEGAVFAFGEPVGDFAVSQSAQTVGYVAQDPDNQLVCSSVWHQMAFCLENMGIPQDEMRRRVAEVSHFFNIEPWFDRDVNDLSGGQKQLLNLASVLVARPRVLLLDEPTAQLDPVAEKNFLHALFRLNRDLGLTVVVATHAPEAARAYATAAVRVRQGALEQVNLDSFELKGVVEVPERQKDVAPEEAISLRDVRLRYTKQGPWVLRGLNLAVGQGEFHALIGGNACGKSTILGAIAGVVKPERGKVENKFAASQAYLPQNPKALFVCDTVDEELREWQRSCGYSDAEIDEALARFGLAGCTSRHPYDLSGGQQQLLAFAKLLLAGPGLLLLDEPTKGLDVGSKLKVAQCLEAYRAQGGTVVMATHDLTFAAVLADEISLIFDGEIASTELASDFFRGNLFYRPSADAFWDAWSSTRGAC